MNIPLLIIGSLLNIASGYIAVTYAGMNGIIAVLMGIIGWNIIHYAIADN